MQSPWQSARLWPLAGTKVQHESGLQCTPSLSIGLGSAQFHYKLPGRGDREHMVLQVGELGQIPPKQTCIWLDYNVHQTGWQGMLVFRR